MIDVYSEELIDLKTASRERPFTRRDLTGKERPCNLSTVWRYVQRGARDNRGNRIKLEVVRTPSGLRTSREAIRRFIYELNGREPVDTTSRTADAATERKHRAKSILAEAGL